MKYSKVLASFDAVWLPLLILAATSWLYAPWLNHVHLGNLAVISVYEGTGRPLAWVFRVGDILGAIIIVLAAWRAKLLRKQTLLGILILSLAALSIIDATFVVGCYQSCDSWASTSHNIHDIESIISLIALAAATAVDSWRSKSLLSRYFLAVQLLAGIVVLTSLVNHNVEVFIQYIYQTLSIIWIAYILRRYTSKQHKITMPSPKYIRLAFAVLIFLGGIIEIMLAFHVRDYGHILGYLHWRSEPIWLAEHSIIVGVIMLYISRYILKGERRAAIIIAAILISEIFKYSIVTPNAFLLGFGELLALLLWIGWSAFDRNTQVSSIEGKMKSLAVLFTGIILALGILIAITSTTPSGRELVQDGRQLFGLSVGRLRSATHEKHLQYRLTHLRYISAGLGISLLTLTLWSIFKPAGKVTKNELDRDNVQSLIKRFATSSEDYFKLWPEDKLYFTTPKLDGFIAYKKVGGTVFALADPVCKTSNKRALLVSFIGFCRNSGWSVCFLMVNNRSKKLYKEAGLNLLHIGSSAIISIQEFVDVTLKDKWWRWQSNRAIKAGMYYEVSRPPHNSSSLIDETEALSSSWLKRANHSEQGFALGYFDKDYLQQCTLHLLRDNKGELVAFANELPIYNDLRQTTVDLIRFRPDVNGAMPILISRILAKLQEGRRFDTFDLGFVPLAKLDNMVARIAKRLASGRFSAAGLEQFKDKFKPQWQPQYMAYEGDLIDLTALLMRLQKALQVEDSKIGQPEESL